MSTPFKKFDPCCSYQPPGKFHKGYSPYEILHTIINMINDFIDYCNGLQGQINSKEDSVNITNSRKLSPNGDFSGTLCGNKTACQVNQEIDDNRQQLQYIAEQFSGGQTGFVIDGGFFDESGIRKNYNGGIF